MPAQEVTPPRVSPLKPVRLLVLVALYVVVAHVLPPPAGVDAQGWRITGVFFATIGGLILQPMPGAQVVLVGVTALVVVAGVPMNEALSGYASPSVWMVLAAAQAPDAAPSSQLAPLPDT